MSTASSAALTRNYGLKSWVRGTGLHAGLVVCLVLLAGCSGKQGPDLSLDDATFVFPVAEQQSSREHTVAFRNVGNAPLIIASLQTSCSCVKAWVDDGPVAPGDSGLIHFVDTGSFEKPFERHIFIRTNEPESPTHTLALVYRGHANVNVVSTAFELMYISPHQKKTARTSILSTDPAFEIRSVESAHAAVEARVAGSSLLDAPAKGGYVKETIVEVTLKANGPPGPVRADVTLATTDKDTKTIVLTVSAEIVDDIESKPRVLTIPEQNLDHSFSFEFEIQSRTQLDFSIFDTQFASGNVQNPGVIVKPSLGTMSPRHRVQITGLTGDQPGPLEGALQLTLTDGRVIQFPVWGYLKTTETKTGD